jgi:hypothetical protein
MTARDGESRRAPDALRRSITDRLRRHARPHGRWTLADLQRQYAYDQLVERLYRVDGGWVIKGATALLARRLAVRHTIDLDVYRAGTLRDIDRDLRRAAALDIGDGMRFDVGPSRTILAAGTDGARLPVTASIGTRTWAQFHVDAVADGIRMTGRPDPVPPLTDIAAPGTDRRPWRAYPLVDHVADKTCAILEIHGGRPSTRFKDLVDLVAIITTSALDADLQDQALHGEAHRRQLALPGEFAVPDAALWAPGYRAEARRAYELAAATLDDALRITRPFLDPLLTHSATGHWHPDTARWILDRTTTA